MTQPTYARSTLPRAPALCQVDVEPHRDAVHVVPGGELDIATVPAVGERLAELFDAGFRRLVLDLRGVPFIDVTALRLILEWSDALRAEERADFLVIAGPPQVQRVFSLTATTERVTFVDPVAVRREVGRYVAWDGRESRGQRRERVPLPRGGDHHARPRA